MLLKGKEGGRTMMNLEFQHGAFESAKAGLLAIGYQTSLFRNNYHFADIFLSTYPIRNIELAVFAQEPPSYRNACFGFINNNGGSSDIANRLEDYRALGAPQIFVLEPDNRTVNRWKMTAEGKPMFLEQIAASNIKSAIIDHSAE